MKKLTKQIMILLLALMLIMAENPLFINGKVKGATLMTNSFDSVQPLILNSYFSLDFKGTGQMFIYEFVPSTTGEYSIYSTGNNDTYARLYNSDQKELAHDDNGGELNNCRLESSLIAGEKYYYGVSMKESTQKGTVTFGFGEVYTIQFDANGGSDAPSSMKKDHDVDLTLSKTVPSRNGYEFLGWSKSQTATSSTYAVGGVFNINKNTTLYAVWRNDEWKPAEIIELNSYNECSIATAGEIIYYKYTAKNSGEYVIYSSGNNDSYVSVHDSSGKTIGANDDGGKDRNFRLVCNMTAGLTYYIGVKFSNAANTGKIAFRFGEIVTIQYDANGGDYAPASQEADYGSHITISKEIPLRPGYNFLGWAISRADVSPFVLPGQTFGSNNSIILFAVWEGTASSIFVNSVPIKTSYSIGDMLNMNGLELLVHYKDGTSEEITSGFTTSGFDSESTGEKVVTITYGGATATIVVYVHDVVTNDYECRLKEDETLEITKYVGESRLVDVPAAINGYTVTSIGAGAFAENKIIQNIYFPDTLVQIGENAFKSCELLSNVGLSSSITTIGAYAFYNCPSLVLVPISESVTYIGNFAFGYGNANELIFGFSFVGYSGTAAEKYASENGITFNNLGEGERPVEIESIKFTKKSVKIKRGKKVTLKVKITGAKKATFSVDKKGKKVVKLSKKKAKSVVVKGKKKGKAAITAKAAGKKAICKVTVR